MPQPWEEYAAAAAAQPAPARQQAPSSQPSAAPAPAQNASPAPWEEYAAAAQSAPQAAATAAPAPAPLPPYQPTWGPTGSTLGAIQQFLSDRPFENPTAAAAARGTGLAARSLVTGVTGTAGLLADTLNAGINLARPADHQLGMPSAALQDALTHAGVPVPTGTSEKILNAVGALATGSRDPVMGAIAGAMRAPAPLYESGLPTTPAPSADRAKTLQDAHDAGYVTTPTTSGAGAVARTYESLVGKSQLERMAEARNQSATNTLARTAAGMTPNEPLNYETLSKKISDTYAAGYEPIRAIPQITNGSVYRHALDDVMHEYGRSGPNRINSEVADLVDSYRTRALSGADAIDYIAKLRAQSADYFRSTTPGSKDLANAYHDVADALENSVALNVKGTPLYDNYTAARTLMAKQNVVRNAVVEGADTVDASKIAGQLRKKVPLTDELAVIGRFANAFPKLATASRSPAGIVTPTEGTILGSAAMSPLFAGVPGRVASIAGVAAGARAAGRAVALSSPFQAAMVPKVASVNPSALSTLFASPSFLNMQPTLLQGLFGPAPQQQPLPPPYQQPQQ